MNRNRILIFLFMLPVLFNRAYSQEPNYQIDLSRDETNWNWQGTVNWFVIQKQKNQVYLKNSFVSSLIQESGRPNSWKDDNNFESGWQIKFSPSIIGTTALKSQIFSNEYSFSKFSKHLLSQKLQLEPWQKVKIIPALGIAAEDINGFQDQGWYTEISADAKDWDLGGYINHSEIFNSIYFFPGRRNQEHRYFIAFNKEFSEYASDSLRVGYEFIKNSYHLALVDYLENVEINSRFLYNQLKYQISEDLNFNIQTKIQSRAISQNNPELLNQRDELNIANELSFTFENRYLQQGLAFLTSQNTNQSFSRMTKRPESHNDLEGRQTAFNLFTRWMVNPTNEIYLTFAYTKYEYTSPDTTLFIDEDDLRFIADLGYNHHFNSYFSANFTTHLYLYHQIYIHESRTANNNWNRIFLLGPGLFLKIPGLLEHTNHFEIMANYTVYDFDQLLPQVSSYLFRNFIFTDSLNLKISPGLNLQTFYQLEKGDDGIFLKNIFAQQVSRELSSQFFDVLLIYNHTENLQIATGANWLFRKEWIMYPMRRLTRDYRAFSPRLTILYRLGSKLMLHLAFSPKIYHNINQIRKYYTTGKVNLKYYF